MNELKNVEKEVNTDTNKNETETDEVVIEDLNNVEQVEGNESSENTDNKDSKKRGIDIEDSNDKDSTEISDKRYESKEQIVKVDDENKVKSWKKILEKIYQTTFQTRIFVLLIGIIILLKTVFLYKNSLFIAKPIKFEYVTMCASFIAIMLVPPMLLKGKIRMWVALVIDLLVSILLFVNQLYYSYSSNLVSVSQLSNLQYGKEISAALPNLLKIRQVLFFIDIVILPIIYFSFRKKLKEKVHFSWVPGILYTVVVVYMAVTIDSSWLKESQVHQYNKIMQVEKSSIYGYHFLDIKNNFNMKKNVKYKNKDSMLNAYNELMNTYEEKYPLQYDFRGIAKDKNVIIVQLESVQNFVVNRTINGKEITPNLNKFLKENIRFTNMQNQSYTTTADSEFTVMTSLYPLENGMSYAQYSSNDYSDIYKNFKNSGYSTTYIHGNVGSFWNRQAVYSRLNIDNLYFDDIFPEDIERINGYVSDEEVYKRIVDDIKKYNEDEKFFVNIIAASSHTAFDLPGIIDKDKKVNIDVGDDWRGIYFGNYLEAVNYADYAFGIFIDRLKEEGLYDDTVILVYGDHAGLQMYNDEMREFIKWNTPLNDIQTQINYTNILCGLKIPGVEPMSIDKPTSKIDMKPTLMEICDVEDEFSLGRSMFSTKDFVCINNGKIITDKYFYDGDWYYIGSGEKVVLESLPQEEIDKLNFYTDSLQKELDISLSTNILNLLKK